MIIGDVYELEKLRDGMWSIEEDGVRSFLLEGEREALLVDTGYGTGDILKAVRSLTEKPVFVVNTHADIDHLGCNALFERVYMHPAEFARYYEEAIPKTAPLPIFEGDIIDLGAFRLEVILTPGHTPGSIMLLERERRFLIAGDSVQCGNIYMFGSGRSMPAYIASLIMLEKKYVSAFDTVYASHDATEVPPDVIPMLIAAATDVVEGRVQGGMPPAYLLEDPLPCMLYSCGGVGFLYQPKD